MDEARFTTDQIRFWKRLGIRALRFFGVACTFVGYIFTVGLLIERGPFDESSLGTGIGLIVLGIPHVIAANRLQMDAEIADPEFKQEPSIARLLSTSFIFPVLILILVLLISAHEPHPSPGLRFLLATIVVYFIGVSIVVFRRVFEWYPSNKLTPWDRTFIRWGWLFLLAIGFPIAVLIVG